MLEKEFQYFLKNHDDLVKNHLGKFIVIQEDAVIGEFNTEADAYIDVVNKGLLGKALIQQCLPGEDSYTQRFHSRAYFGTHKD